MTSLDKFLENVILRYVNSHNSLSRVINNSPSRIYLTWVSSQAARYEMRAEVCKINIGALLARILEAGEWAPISCMEYKRSSSERFVIVEETRGW